MLYTHIRGRGSVSDSVAGASSRKGRVFGDYVYTAGPTNGLMYPIRYTLGVVPDRSFYFYTALLSSLDDY